MMSVPTKFKFGVLILNASEASKDGGPGEKFLRQHLSDRWKVPIFVKKSPLKEAV